MGWRGPMTQRQFETWMVWQLMEDERLDLTHQYLIQLTQEVFRLNFILCEKEKMPELKMEQFKLKFKRVNEKKAGPDPSIPTPSSKTPTRGMTSEEMAAIWGARLGATRKVNRKKGGG
jgi:hypothetical protein